MTDISDAAKDALAFAAQPSCYGFVMPRGRADGPAIHRRRRDVDLPSSFHACGMDDPEPWRELVRVGFVADDRGTLTITEKGREAMSAMSRFSPSIEAEKPNTRRGRRRQDKKTGDLFGEVA